MCEQEIEHKYYFQFMYQQQHVSRLEAFYGNGKHKLFVTRFLTSFSSLAFNLSGNLRRQYPNQFINLEKKKQFYFYY